MPRSRRRSSFLNEVRRLRDIKPREVRTSVNSFVGEIESVADNPTPANIMERLIELSDNSADETPQRNFYKLIEILDARTYGAPRIGDVFTFGYRAKTPNLIYDLHPVTEIRGFTKNGFYGWNYHLGMIRQYDGSNSRVFTNFYKIDPDELEVVLSINTKLLLKT